MSREKFTKILYEKHHIIPRSLGGTNNISNLVNLLPREHFICHLLLPKMTTGIQRRKMSFALKMMTCSNKNHDRSFKITSKMYEIIKKLSSAAHKERWNEGNLKKEASERNKKQWGNQNWKEVQIALIKERWSDPELKKQQSIAQHARWSDPELRRIQSEKLIGIPNPKKALPGKLNGIYGIKRPAIMAIANAASVAKSKGKTYEEIYGAEKAQELKKIKSIKLKEYLKNNPNSRLKSYKIISPEGTIYTIVGNLEKFCKEHKIYSGKMYDVLKGRLESYNGWKVSVV